MHGGPSSGPQRTRPAWPAACPLCPTLSQAPTTLAPARSLDCVTKPAGACRRARPWLPYGLRAHSSASWHNTHIQYHLRARCQELAREVMGAFLIFKM
jgi:hypothetical protein